ncbi:MAG TPA: response regulator transcription factor [Terriglobales bacterium]|nr:response regulator transcription factor [Terriglobales bacterium]
MQPLHPEQISIVIADDHAIVRDGLKRLLHEEPDFVVIAEAHDGEQALAMTRELRPAILLLDVAMPVLDGIEVLRHLAEMAVPTRIILLTAAITRAQIRTALELGARGVIMKTSAIDTLVKSIRCVLAGEFWVDRSTLVDMVRPAREESPAADLTPREMELVEEIASGSCNRDIAEKFAISEKTVKRHLVNIFDKLGVSSRLELAVFAMHQGIVKPKPNDAIREKRR